MVRSVALAFCAMASGCGAFDPVVGPLNVPLDVAAGLDADTTRRDGAVDAGADGAASDGGESGRDAAPTLHEVRVGPGQRFAPEVLTLRVGDTVRWVWQASGHTVTSGSAGAADGKFCSVSDTNCGSAPSSPAGTVYEHRFDAAGAFPYFCRVHRGEGMTGELTVVP